MGEDRVVQLLLAIIPPLRVLTYIDSVKQLAIFLIGRLAVFLGILCLSGQSFEADFHNPYFLIFGATLFALIFAILFKPFKWLDDFDRQHGTGTLLLFVFLLLPFAFILLIALAGLVAFETLLAAYNPVFFLADIAVSLIAAMASESRQW